MIIPLWGGLFATSISIVAFGFLSTPMKVKWVRTIDPMFIQLFMSIPILCAGLCAYPFTSNIPYSVYGLMGAVLWVPASSLSIFAVRLAGISVAQSCWGGVTIITAYICGILICHETFSNLYCQIGGLLFLICGIVCISLSHIVTLNPLKMVVEDDEGSVDFSSARVGQIDALVDELTPINDIETTEEKIVAKKYKSRLYSGFGICIAIIMGIFNGISMVPAKFETNTFAYIFTFGVAQFFIGNVVVLFYFQLKGIIFKDVSFNRTAICKTALSGLMCGTIWVVGYAGQLVSVWSTLGLSTGFVLVQTTIVISSIVGICLFKELRGWLKILVFSLGVLLIFPGVFLLYFFK